jgi:hypothetical protein
MLLSILTITALPITAGFLVLRYDEKKRQETGKSADGNSAK